MTDMTYRNYMAPPEHRQFSGMAITGFVFSLLWLGGFGSLAAVVVCGIAMKRAKTRGQNGRGLAVAGLILGVLGLLASIWLVLVLVGLGSAMDSEFQSFSDCVSTAVDPSTC
jgi:hypothetical protein